MAPDYPDWMFGYDAQEGARRGEMGVAASRTGSVLWSTSFENGLAEFTESAPAEGTAVRSSLYSFHGAVSCRLITGAVFLDQAGLWKRITPVVYTKAGVEIYFMDQGGGGDEYKSFTLLLHLLDAAAPTKDVRAEFVITRDGSGNGFIQLEDADAGFVTLPFTLPYFFVPAGGVGNVTYFHQIKMTVDFTKSPPEYSKLIIDGVEYDISAYHPPITTNLLQRSAFEIIATLWTFEAVSHAGFIDAWTLTINEP